ncbi:unnamed protein product [Polarella glacialis]|uniref:Uncharacterized protein n=1 Tax=Polarella glacialis TaxID=89957 RepID=A0A813KQV9_POLGL|nr:unnamed protein product [Polarella glacialis]
MPELQRMLRDEKASVSASTTEAFHASVEVTRSEDVRAEYLLERVSRFFTVDGAADYSLQWFLQEDAKQVEHVKTLSSRKISSDQCTASAGIPGNYSQSIRASQKPCRFFTQGRDALSAVAEALGPWSWVFVGPGPESVQIVGGGAGSVDEMQACPRDTPEAVMFVLLRMGFGQSRLRRTKYVLFMPGV